MSDTNETEPNDSGSERRRQIGEMRYQLVDQRTQLRYIDPETAPVSRAVAALREGGTDGALLAAAVEGMAEGFVLFDAADRLVLCNRKYREFYAEIADLLTPGRSYGEIAAAATERAARMSQSIRLDGWVRQDNRGAAEISEHEIADQRWVAESEQAVAGGGRVGVSTEITDLKRREDALRESRRRFRDIAAAASDWFWETDEEGSLVYLSERLPQITGKGPDALLGRSLRAIAGDEAANWAELEAAIAARRPFRDFGCRLRDVNGVQREMRLSGQPNVDAGGAFRGYRGAGRDVTLLALLPGRARVALDGLAQAIDTGTPQALAEARAHLAALRGLIDELGGG